MYSDKKRVVEASTSLYITILKAIEEVIGYYTRHMAEKAIKALWNGRNYEKSLLESLENISRDGRELIDEANIAHKQVTNKMAGNAEAVLRKTEQIELSIENIKAGANFFIKSLFGDHIKEREAEVARREQSLRREIERQDDERAMWQQLYFRAVTPEPSPAPKSIVSQENILEFLDLRDMEKIDIEYILNQNELMFAGGHSRTEQIMKSAQFRSWLVQADSKELLIHGNSSPERISPISFFTSMLLKNLRDVEQFKSVAFFCGMHSYEDYGGARTLVMSLLTQLLQQQRFDLSFIDHRLAGSLDAGNIAAFCHLFRELLQQVKDAETVFCVIDGINFYECYGEDLLQETADVLCFLLDLTRRRGAVFKILITSASNTLDVRQAFRDEDFFGLPEQAKDTSGFSSLRFERGLTESFED
ncbi:hypothetical protein KJ359_009852 [Pestalotiopsis sp. 9143b]|nr:hypothetical protein KJ359_009852 [Pestalotiopsis sp. 9143b]